MEAYSWNPVMDTPQKLNLNIAPESHDGKLEDDPFASFGGRMVNCQVRVVLVSESIVILTSKMKIMYIIYTLQGTNISPKNSILSR